MSRRTLNAHLQTFIVAPMISGGHAVLDQVRTIDRYRLIRRMGRLSAVVLDKSLRVLQEMFAK